VYDRIGIALGPSRQSMVSSRIAKRLRATQTTTVRAYLDLVKADKQGEELMHLLDAITTNTTSFFREPAAFAALDEDVRARLSSGQRQFRIWPAAASTGMEAYTIAMLLAENGATARDCAILATDISTRALAACRAGTYTAEALAPVPPKMLARWFAREGDGMRIHASLRALVTANRLNLVKPPYPMRGPFDAIFCRNVMIYFDLPVRQRLVSACLALLRPGGLFLIGAAESLYGLDHPLSTVRPSVYRR